MKSISCSNNISIARRFRFFIQSKSKIEKLIRAAYKKVFNTFAPNFYYLLLNKIAKEYLMQDGFLKKEEILENQIALYSFKQPLSSTQISYK